MSLIKYCKRLYHRLRSLPRKLETTTAIVIKPGTKQWARVETIASLHGKDPADVGGTLSDAVVTWEAIGILLKEGCIFTIVRPNGEELDCDFLSAASGPPNAVRGSRPRLTLAVDNTKPEEGV